MADLLNPGRFMRVVDRRGDPPGRGTVNRERFVRRFKDEIKRAVDDQIGERKIADIGKGGKVSIPGRGLAEPSLHHDQQTGSRDFVLPGNREYVPGDAIKRPPGGAGQGGANGDEPGRGEGTDSFAFVLSKDEFLALFFDDLELPNLERTKFGDVVQEKKHRAGYSKDGTPGNLSAVATIKMSIARRIALRGALGVQIEQLEEQVERAEPAGRAELEQEIARLKQRRDKLPFLEDIDRRYRARVSQPAPATRAVMLCLMDVSGSMDERKKDLAKRFFALLYLFLERKYGAVDIVFIRHTETAQEVDEDTFFHDPQSGGTLVLPALELAHRVITKRYASGEWNVYLAQASDGDCGLDDGKQSVGFVQHSLMPLVRYFAYIDIPSATGWFNRPSDLWQSYEALDGASFAKHQVRDRRDIWPVLRKLFARREAAA
jgi:uncharacterized sporulation protein YeaH/YhbH (DUF444 family)